MTEQLSEAKQRGIYGWFYPELKGKNWTLWHGANLFAYDSKTGKGICLLVPLYMPEDGKENWNFVRECVEKLEQEHVRVMYDTADHLWYFWFLDNKGAGAVIKNLGFWFALSDLLEGE